MARRRKYLTGPPCPTGGEAHGGMYDIGPGQWWCPHAAHHGVAYTVGGERVKKQSRFVFTDKEATEAQEAYWRGA